MNRLRSLLPLFALALGVWLAIAGVAQAVERVTWGDLTPPFDQSKDPFSALNEEQQDALYDLIWVRNLRNISGDESQLSDVERAGEQAARETLAAGGLNADVLLAELEAFDQQIAVWNETLVDDLDGKVIQIAGYALPLEFSDTAITEFLLVPYVGACIHVPPPPINQIVHVRVEEGYESEGVFAPVWVTGRISTQPQSLSLTLVDGSSNVRVGYGLEAAKIQPYESNN